MRFIQKFPTCPRYYVHQYLPYLLHQFVDPVLRKLTICLRFILFSNNLISILYFTLNWDFELFVSVGHTNSSSFIAMVLTQVGLRLSEKIFKIMELKKEMWSFENINRKVSQKIARNFKKLQRQRFFITAFTMSAIVSCFPISGDYREFMIIAYIIEDEKYHRTIQSILLFLVIIPILYCVYIVNSIIFTTCFIMYDLSSHILLIREKLKSIKSTYGEKNDLFYSGIYQRNIKEILGQCIAEHVRILRYVKIMRKLIQSNIIIGVLAGIICLTFLFFNTKTHMELRRGVNCIFIQTAIIMFFYFICYGGQVLSDEVVYCHEYHNYNVDINCELLYRDICESPWFLWNIPNKRSYLIFLTCTRDPIIFSSLEMSINFNLLLISARRTLSFLAALENLTSIN